MNRRRAAVAAVGLMVSTAVSGATRPGVVGAPPGASACSGCHAVDAGAGSAVPGLFGRPSAEIEAALAAFRAGERPATVMNRIAPGFTEAESRAIAVWLSAQAPP